MQKCEEVIRLLSSNGSKKTFAPSVRGSSDKLSLDSANENP